MSVHEALQLTVVFLFSAVAWRVGTARAFGGILIALVYVVVSGFAWQAGGGHTLAILSMAHLTGAVVCLLFSTTRGGNLAGLMFVCLMVLDGITAAGLVPFEREAGVFWAGAYADWKGVLSYGILVAIGFGIVGPSRYRPVFSFGPGPRRGGASGFPLRVENEERQATGRR